MQLKGLFAFCRGEVIKLGAVVRCETMGSKNPPANSTFRFRVGPDPVPDQLIFPGHFEDDTVASAGYHGISIGKSVCAADKWGEVDPP